MLVITARIFKDNQLIGYQLSDGRQTQLFSKLDTWKYAKNKQILNVVASGTPENPSLSGVNGFELKKLPEFKEDKAKNHPISRYILVQSILTDKLTPTVVGYKIKNVGYMPIQFTRVTATPDHSTSEYSIQPNEEICISSAEFALLVKRYGRTLANGEVKFTQNDCMHNYGNLGEHYPVTYSNLYRFWRFKAGGMSFNYINNDIEREYKDKKDINLKADAKLTVDTESLQKYFSLADINDTEVKGNYSRKLVLTRTLKTPFNNTIIGFEIKNIGDKALIIKRMTVTSEHTESVQILPSNSTMWLNKAELGSLACFYGTKLANGEIHFVSAGIDDITGDAVPQTYEVLERSLRFKFYDNERQYSTEQLKETYFNKYTSDFALDIYTTLPDEEITKYFIPTGETTEKYIKNKVDNDDREGIIPGVVSMLGMFRR